MEALIVKILAVMICISVHEFSHGYVAYLLGDKTAKNAGRLTLNPLAHFDIIGILMFVFIGFGWAKPVPINISNFKKPKRDVVAVSIAGPLSNFLLAFSLIFLTRIGLKTQNEYLFYVANFAYITACYSVALGVFNLIPIHPLDGSKIIGPFLPKNTQIFMYKNQQFMQFALIIGLYFGLLSAPLIKVQYFIVNLLTDVVKLIL